MSVFDYIKSSDFSEYERRFLSVLIGMSSCDKLSFLKDIDLEDVIFRWYDDSDNAVQGGFYYPSRNIIYINRNAFPSVSDPSSFSQVDFRIVSAFPVILHEMYHYWQSRHYGILYLFMQLPYLRNYLIETEAYRVEDAAYELPFLSCGLSRIAKIKKEAGFGEEFFDAIEKKCLKS